MAKPKTKKALTKEEEKAVAKIAKKVVLKTVETKSAASSSYMTPAYTDVIRVQNLNYFIGQGAGDTNYLGTEIMLKNLNINMLLVRNGTAQFAGVYNTPVYARVVVFKTKVALTNSQANMSVSELFRADGVSSEYAALAFCDLDKVTVLYDKKILMSSPTALTGTAAVVDNYKQINIKVPIKKKKTWDADNSGHFKDGDYYLAVCYTDATHGMPAYITFDYNWVVNFKDA